MKFAHIADAHLGAFTKSKALRECNLNAFRRAVEISIEENVDFILIAGDLFHNPLPDMDTVRSAVEILNGARSKGIRIYVVYGSHDFSAGTTSLLDVLAEAGVFKKVTKYEMRDGKIRLLPVTDESGVKLVGMPGLTSAMEVRYFTEGILDIEYLESIPEPKVFVFHTTIAELKPEYIADKKAVPLNTLPRDFNYYAAGHLHERIESSYDGAPLIYTGALFGATYNDLDTLSGKKRGFYIVENFKPRFVPVEICDFEKVIYDATGKSAKDVEKELLDFSSQDHEGKVVILKVRGEMHSGKVADIDFRKIREEILKTALDALINTYSLTTRERKAIRVPASNHEEIENRVFSEISTYGLTFTRELFRILKIEKSDEETKENFENRLLSSVRPILQEAVEGHYRDEIRIEIENDKEKAEKSDKKIVEDMSNDASEEVPAEKNEENTAKSRDKKRPATLFDFG